MSLCQKQISSGVGRDMTMEKLKKLSDRYKKLLKIIAPMARYAAHLNKMLDGVDPNFISLGGNDYAVTKEDLMKLIHFMEEEANG